MNESPEQPPGEDTSRLAHRLDPDQAAAAAAGGSKPPPAEEVVDTRRYRWMIGIFGITLVLVLSVYQFVSHGIGTTGVPAGQRLHYFAAPLAVSTLEGDANLKPPCALARHDPRALNICLLAQRGPLVLAFFVTGSDDCKRQVDVMQAIARRFPGIQFAAIAVRTSHAGAAAVVRSHHWTIPVAYDRDGAVGALYGVEICPMLELARKGGTVIARLIGNHWLAPASLTARVESLR